MSTEPLSPLECVYALEAGAPLIAPRAGGKRLNLSLVYQLQRLIEFEKERISVEGEIPDSATKRLSHDLCNTNRGGDDVRIELDVNDFRLEPDELLAKIEEILGISEFDFVEEDMGVVYERDANATVSWCRRPLNITPEVYRAYKTLRDYIKAKG